MLGKPSPLDKSEMETGGCISSFWCRDWGRPERREPPVTGHQVLLELSGAAGLQVKLRESKVLLTGRSVCFITLSALAWFH